VVAIPRGDGRWQLAVVVARNQFGTAFGVFSGCRPAARPFARDETPQPLLAYPSYSDDRQILVGYWRVVGHDQALLEPYGSDPELLHRPRLHSPVDRGPNGSAETPGGDVRLLSGLGVAVPSEPKAAAAEPHDSASSSRVGVRSLTGGGGRGVGRYLDPQGREWQRDRSTRHLHR
jgi:hypothetical protein